MLFHVLLQGISMTQGIGLKESQHDLLPDLLTLYFGDLQIKASIHFFCQQFFTDMNDEARLAHH